VAFFLYGGCALMQGAGDVLVRRLPLPPLDVLVVKPQGGVSTAAAYALFDQAPVPAAPVEPLLAALEAGYASMIAASLANNFCDAAGSLCPDVPGLIHKLRQQPGVLQALLSGSGSAVFAICSSREACLQAAAAFERQGYWTCATMFADYQTERLQ
jgi:4-diphosphocytidyl-2-C-methyl-D-erythritol kinase